MMNPKRITASRLCQGYVGQEECREYKDKERKTTLQEGTEETEIQQKIGRIFEQKISKLAKFVNPALS
jgi:hypothetical protein